MHLGACLAGSCSVTKIRSNTGVNEIGFSLFPQSSLGPGALFTAALSLLRRCPCPRSYQGGGGAPSLKGTNPRLPALLPLTSLRLQEGRGSLAAAREGPSGRLWGRGRMARGPDEVSTVSLTGTVSGCACVCACVCTHIHTHIHIHTYKMCMCTCSLCNIYYTH